MSTHEGLVVVKLGGGLITRKDTLCEANMDTIDALVSVLSSLYHAGVNMIVVHGAGSFGMVVCKISSN